MNDIKLLKQKIHHLKVLVVDDEKEVLNITFKFLNKFFDHVDKASNGQEAYKLYEQKGGYDIILSDVKMPVLSGWELMRKLRDINTEAFLAIMTGSNEESAQDKALCDILLNKPIGLKSILDMFEKYINIKKIN